jgi:hypothetical protein
MRVTDNQQVIALFGGERVAPGYRGRRHDPHFTNKVSCRIAIAFAAGLIGFATAATAITVRHANHTERSINAGANLAGGVSGSVGFEAALY